MDEEDQLRFGFDLFDPTKIVPEEYVPITKLGKMTLNRNPLNYFAETEQVMVCPSLLPCLSTRITYMDLTDATNQSNRTSSNPATSSAESTLPKTLCCRAVSSRTSTPS